MDAKTPLPWHRTAMVASLPRNRVVKNNSGAFWIGKKTPNLNLLAPSNVSLFESAGIKTTDGKISQYCHILGWLFVKAFYNTAKNHILIDLKKKKSLI